MYPHLPSDPSPSQSSQWSESNVWVLQSIGDDSRQMNLNVRWEESTGRASFPV